jgi:ABC-type transport system substrate-binding protein
MTATDVSAPTSATSLDAITVTDRNTARTFVSQLAGTCSFMSSSDNAGASSTPTSGCAAGALLDHQSVGGGPFHAGSPVQAVTSYPDAVYYCAQDSYNGQCSVSQDGGLTFNPAVPAYNNPANDSADPNTRRLIAQDSYPAQRMHPTGPSAASICSASSVRPHEAAAFFAVCSNSPYRPLTALYSSP